MLNIKAILKREDIRKFVSESWALCWPMTLIMFFEFLIGLTDIYIAGRVGKEIQATYGFVIQLYFIFVIIGNALSIGTVAVISRLFTSNDREELTKAVYSTVITTVVAGIIFGIAGIIFTPEIISIVNIPHQLKTFAVPLGRIYAVGLLFHYILINSNGILRACKKVRSSLQTMAIVCFSNIGLNFFLVFHTHLGFRGIAISTATSVFIGSILNLWRIRVFMSGAKRFSLYLAKSIIGIGWPSGLLQILWQFHLMVIFLILSALPEHNVEILAALSVGIRIESAIFLPAIAFNMANAVIVGNLLGEKRKEDAFRAGIITALMGAIIVIFLTIIVILNARWIASFLSTNDVVIAESIKYLYISMLSEPFMALWVILGGALNGAGDTRGVMVIVALSLWLVRIPLSYIFVVVFGFGAVSVWWVMNLSQFLMALFMTRRYLKRKWLER
jgi:putative MATE family efflux protein